VFTLLFRSSDELILEHERRDSAGSRYGRPLKKALQVHAGFDNTQNSRDLPFVLCRE